MSETLEKSFENLTKTALRVKASRDHLLCACTSALEILDNVYDVDEPELGHRKEYPFSGAGELMNKLRTAIAFAIREDQ